MEQFDAPKYIPIPIETIQSDKPKSFDLYLKTSYGEMILYNAKNENFTEEIRINVLAKSFSVFYILDDNINAYNDYIVGNLAGFLANPDKPTKEKSEFAYTTISSIGKSLFHKPTKESIDSYKASIMKTMDFVLKEEGSISSLINLTHFDFTTYNHSMNVGIFATGLAKILFSGNDAHNMEEIASGFFLHDIGKSQIPLSILTKPGPLNEEEWGVMKNHPMKGYIILDNFDHITKESQLIVLQHHERHNGLGYPQGIGGNDIHIYAKICCIADVFEALVAKRPYKPQKSFFEALKIMREQMFEDFDPAFFKEFVLLFSQKDIMK
jgi:HD-GYP domain-containing protein (c-di-GMP phosphodiesterase class II)